MIVECCASCRRFQMDDFDYGLCVLIQRVVCADDKPCFGYLQCNEEDLPEAYDLLDEVCRNEEEEQ